MMVAVLLGALSLGACVDNDESASVEAVRNAKAEQLKGAAALANAQAEAETIRANAEAKLKEAEAAYQDAKTEADKAKWAAKLTVIQAEAARDIAKAQKLRKMRKWLLLLIRISGLTILFGGIIPMQVIS